MHNYDTTFINTTLIQISQKGAARIARTEREWPPVLMRLASSTNDEPEKRCEETAAAKTELSTAARNDSESERRKGITGSAILRPKSVAIIVNRH